MKWKPGRTASLQNKNKKNYMLINYNHQTVSQASTNWIPGMTKHKQQNQSSLKKQSQMNTLLRQIESLEASSFKGSIPCKLMSPTSPKEATFKIRDSIQQSNKIKI